MDRIETLTGRAFFAALVAVTLAGCSQGEADGGVAEAAEPTGRIVSVEVLEIQPEAFADYVQIVGQVAPNREVVVSAEEAGTIRELMVPKGAIVQAGQPIARINDSVLRPQLEQATAEAALARETWNRQRRLWEEDRVGSEMVYLQARYRAETADAMVRGLTERLNRTVVRAPISGVLDSRLVEVGTLVSPGTPLAKIVDLGVVKIAAGVPERFSGQIQRGTSVEVFLEGGNGVGFPGRIEYIGATVEPANRTFPVEIVVPNRGATLKPGMIANVRLTRATMTQALVVPQDAVIRVEDGYIVFVATARGTETFAEARPVTLGSAQANRVIIGSGLRPADKVVVVGQNRLANGDKLQVVESSAGRAE